MAVAVQVKGGRMTVGSSSIMVVAIGPGAEAILLGCAAKRGETHSVFCKLGDVYGFIRNNNKNDITPYGSNREKFGFDSIFF